MTKLITNLKEEKSDRENSVGNVTTYIDLNAKILKSVSVVGRAADTNYLLHFVFVQFL